MDHILARPNLPFVVPGCFRDRMYISYGRGALNQEPSCQTAPCSHQNINTATAANVELLFRPFTASYGEASRFDLFDRSSHLRLPTRVSK